MFQAEYAILAVMEERIVHFCVMKKLVWDRETALLLLCTLRFSKSDGEPAYTAKLTAKPTIDNKRRQTTVDDEAAW
jgi:hypothetical protein